MASAARRVTGEATTEELLRALIHHRALFDDLVNHRDAIAAEKAPN